MKWNKFDNGLFSSSLKGEISKLKTPTFGGCSNKCGIWPNCFKLGCVCQVKAEHDKRLTNVTLHALEGARKTS